MRLTLLAAIPLALLLAIGIFWPGAPSVLHSLPAWLGLTLLVAVLVGELLARLQLPRIFGYLVVGAALGPNGAAFLTESMATELEPIRQLAYAGVAFLVGSRLALGLQWNLTRRVVRLTLSLALFSILVTGSLAALLTGVFSDRFDNPWALLLGMWLLGLCFCASSSEQYLGVADEVEPDELFAKLVFGTTIVMELLAVVAVLVTLGFLGISLGFHPAPQSSTSWIPTESLGVALVAGASIGLLVALTAWMHRPWSIVGLGLILVAGWRVCLASSAPLLVCFFFGGMLSVRLGKKARAFASELWRWAPVFFAVFFLLLGFRIPLSLAVLPAALGLVLVRLVVLHLSTWVGTWDSRKSVERIRGGGLAFLGQGASFFLLAESLRSLIEPQVYTILVGAGAFNTLVAPIFLRAILAPRQQPETPRSVKKPPDLPVARIADQVLPPFENSELGEVFARLESKLRQIVVRFREELEIPQSERLVDFIADFRSACIAGAERIEHAFAEAEGSDHEIARLATDVKLDVVHGLRRAIPDQIGQQEGAAGSNRFLAYLSSIRRLIDDQPTLTLPLEESRFSAISQDGIWIRWLKWLRRLGRGFFRLFGRRRWVRQVPIRQLGRFYLSSQIGYALAISQNGLAVQRIDLWRRARVLFNQLESYTNFFETVASRTEPVTLEQLVRFREELDQEFDVVQRDLRFTGDQVLTRFGRRLNELLTHTGRAALLAGTVELPRWRYSPHKAAEQRRGHRLRLRESETVWNRVIVATANAFAMRLEGEIVLNRYDSIFRRCLQTVSEETLSNLHYLPDEIALQCEEVQRRIESAFGPSQDDAAQLTGLIGQQWTLLEGFISRIAIGEIAAFLEPRAARQGLDEFFEQTERVFADLPESFSTRVDPFAELSLVDTPPEFDAVEFPFRELVREVLGDEVRAYFREVQDRLTGFFQDLLGSLTDMVHFLAFHIEAAIQELSLTDQAPDLAVARDFAISSLAEGLQRIRGLARQGQENQQTLTGDMSQMVLRQMQVLRDILSHGNVDEALRRAGLAKLGPHPPIKAPLAPTQGQPAEERQTWQASLRQSLISLKGNVGRRLRPVTQAHQAQEQPPDLARFERFRKEGIPHAYRRLFETAAFGVEDILAGQDREMTQFSAAVEAWKEGRRTAIAVVGERGAGRTTLVERCRRRFLFEVDSHHHRLASRVQTEKALARELSTFLFGKPIGDLRGVSGRLNKNREKTVVILEEAQYLMLKTPEGIAPLTAFFDFLGRTAPHILWIVTVDTVSWTFMDTFLSASDMVTEVIPVAPLGRRDTEELILQRHQVSGFGLEFRLEQREGEPMSARAKRIDVGVLQQRYFDALYEASGGHPLLSMFLWLDSVVQVPDKTTIAVSLPLPLHVDWIRELGTERLLALREIMLHGTLTEEELSEVIRIDRNQAAAMLERLCAMLLLERAPGKTPTYSVNSVLFKSIFDLLQDEGMI